MVRPDALQGVAGRAGGGVTGVEAAMVALVGTVVGWLLSYHSRVFGFALMAASFAGLAAVDYATGITGPATGVSVLFTVLCAVVACGVAGD